MRKWLAIIGLVLTLLIAGVYVASVWWEGGRWGNSMGHRVAVSVSSGCVLVAYVGEAQSDLVSPLKAGWEFHRSDIPMQWWFVATEFFDAKLFVIPLWTPFLLTAIPTFFLWPRPFRRPRPGHCRACGYDLKGVPSSTCPECGKGAA